jgi:8-oxo-dGTP pyrophosphatase MutT (NUDIX family)
MWNEMEETRVPDFIKRVCAIRETYEETGILLLKDFKQPEGKPDQMSVLEGYNSDFTAYCQHLDKRPNIEQIFPFFRFGSPLGVFPPVDNLMYAAFASES